MYKQMPVNIHNAKIITFVLSFSLWQTKLSLETFILRQDTEAYLPRTE